MPIQTPTNNDTGGRVYGTTYLGHLRLNHAGNGCYPCLFSTSALAAQHIERLKPNVTARRNLQIVPYPSSQFAGQIVFLDGVMAVLSDGETRPAEKCPECCGFVARRVGQAETDNPFTPGTQACDEWAAGWKFGDDHGPV